MDHDLLLDLSHLDDHDPPQFGALRAEEAARLAARHQAHRARLVAGAIVAVALLAGGLVATVGSRHSDQHLEAAQPPVATTLVDPTIALFATTVPGALPAPTPPVTNPPATRPDPAPTLPPGAVAGGPTPSATAPAATTATAPTGAATPTTRPPTQATGQPPVGTQPEPAGLRLTLTLDSGQVGSGGSIRGIVRFENNRSTPVTLGQVGCAILGAGLYDAGQSTATGAPSCPAQVHKVVAPGAAEQVEVQVGVPPGLGPGTYDAYATTHVDEDVVNIHSGRVVVTVVRP